MARSLQSPCTQRSHAAGMGAMCTHSAAMQTRTACTSHPATRGELLFSGSSTLPTPDTLDEVVVVVVSKAAAAATVAPLVVATTLLSLSSLAIIACAASRTGSRAAAASLLDAAASFS